MILNLWVESFFAQFPFIHPQTHQAKPLGSKSLSEIHEQRNENLGHHTHDPQKGLKLLHVGFSKTFSKCLLHYHPLKGWHFINVAFNNNRIATMVARDQFFHQMIFEGSRANPSAWSHVLLSRKLLIPQWLRQSSILPFPLAEWASPHPLSVLDTRSLASQIHT